MLGLDQSRGRDKRGKGVTDGGEDPEGNETLHLERRLGFEQNGLDISLCN